MHRKTMTCIDRRAQVDAALQAKQYMLKDAPQ